MLDHHLYLHTCGVKPIHNEGIFRADHGLRQGLDEYFYRIWCDGRATLANRKTLNSINANGTHITNEGVKSISELPFLIRLHLDRDYTSAFSLRMTQRGPTQLPHVPATHKPRGKLTDRSMKAIASLSDMTFLSVKNQEITDEGVAAIGQFRNLTYLGLGGTKVTDEATKTIAKLESLEVLYLDGCAITDAGLNRLSRLPTLESLSLKNTQITDDGLAALHNAKKLDTVFIRGSKATVKGGAALRDAVKTITYIDLVPKDNSGPFDGMRFAKIEDLGGKVLQARMPGPGPQWVVDFSGKPIRDEQLECLQSISDAGYGWLANVDLSGTQVTDMAFNHLRFPRLMFLNLSDTRVTGAGIDEALGGQTALRVLRLDRSAVNDESFQDVCKLRSLALLSVSETKVTEKGLQKIAALKNLRQITVGKGQLDAGYSESEMSHLGTLPSLQAIVFRKCKITQPMLKSFASSPSLRALRLENVSLEQSAADQLSELQGLASVQIAQTNLAKTKLAGLGTLKQMGELHLMECELSPQTFQGLERSNSLGGIRLNRSDMTGDKLQTLQSMSSLTHLDLSECKMDSASWKSLAELNELSGLMLEKTGMADDDFSAIAGQLSSVEMLILSGNKLTAKSVSKLQGSRSLRMVSFAENPLGDEAVDALCKLDTLKYLHIAKCGISDAGVEKIRKELQCQVVADEGQ